MQSLEQGTTTSDNEEQAKDITLYTPPTLGILLEFIFLPHPDWSIEHLGFP